jgi:hypothetical protein
MTRLENKPPDRSEFSAAEAVRIAPPAVTTSAETASIGLGLDRAGQHLTAVARK